MNSATEVNRELTRLDSELRAGGIDRSMFRSKRRKLLLDFEERQTTTTPGVMSGNEVTVVDAPEALPLPASTPSPSAAASSGTSATRRPALGIAVLVIGVLVVLALAGWWVFKPQPAVATMPAAAPAAGASAPAPAAPIAGAETPQSVASALLATEWKDADVADFLRHWGQLSPEAIKAATEDSRIWLLRGETGRRLREAREAESVEHSAELQVRVHQLEQLQAIIRSP